METQASERISGPVEAVWAFVGNPANMHRWVSGVDEPPLLDSDTAESGAGTRFRMKYRYAGKTHDVVAEVAESDAPRKQTIRWIEGPFPFEASLELRADGGGTTVVRTVSAGADSRATAVTFAVAGPLLRMLMRKQIRKDLGRAKELIESSSAEP